MNISRIFVLSCLFSTLYAKQQNQVFQSESNAMPPYINTDNQQQSIYQENISDNLNKTSQISTNSQNSQQALNNNQFLEPYDRQNFEFSATVYFKEANNLTKRNISQDDLKKAVVVIFGDWCPHCKNFLDEFSKNIDILTMNGIKIIFLHIPSIERLKNWQNPTLDEFNAAENKISSHGIKLSKQSFIALLGDTETLAKTAIEGLPIVVAVKNGKERFRGVGEKGTSKLRLSDQATLNDFLGIWEDFGNQTMKTQNKTINTRNKKTNSLSKAINTKVNRKEAKTATKLLNETFLGNGTCCFGKFYRH